MFDRGTEVVKNDPNDWNSAEKVPTWLYDR